MNHQHREPDEPTSIENRMSPPVPGLGAHATSPQTGLTHLETQG